MSSVIPSPPSPMLAFISQVAFVNGPSVTANDLSDSFSSNQEIFPSWFTAIYWTLIIIISLLATIIQAGQSHVSSLTSTAKAVLSLIILDTLAYLTLVLSAIMLAIAFVVSRPWEAITPTFIAPLAAFVASWIFAQAMQAYERRMLTLWLRVSSMTIVNPMMLDLNTLRKSLDATLQLPAAATVETESDVIALVRADTPGGIAKAASNKGSPHPFITAINIWWYQGSAQRLPRVIVRQRVRGRARWRVCRRIVSHSSVIRELIKAGRAMRTAEGEPLEEQATNVLIATAFDQSARRVVHARFGNVWMRVARQPGLKKRTEGWWFVGAEIVQGLKAACGISSLSGPDRFDDVKELWSWVDSLGYGWRKEFQVEPIASEIARMAQEDENVVRQVALEVCGVTGKRAGCTVRQRALAVEANAVACLGLAIRATISELQWHVEEVSQRLNDILLGQDGCWTAHDMSGAAVVVAIERSSWPEDELSRMLFRWVGEAAIAMGRPGGPGIVS